jgi:hypothetical protein
MFSGVGNSSHRPIGSSGSKPDPSVGKHLKSEGFSNVLQGLGINPKDVSSISQLRGMALEMNLGEAQYIQLNQSTSEALKGMGIQNATLAMVLSGNDEVDRLKKRLKEIQESMINKDDMQSIFNLLGVEFDQEALAFQDSKGGILLVRSGLDEIVQD